jgi:hypothetical protein
MSQRVVHLSILFIALGTLLGLPGCSQDHKEEGQQIANRLTEELIDQQMKGKVDSTTKDDNTRAQEIQEELSNADLTADEMRLMLDSLQKNLTTAQQKAPLEKKSETEKNSNGKPISTSH